MPKKFKYESAVTPIEKIKLQIFAVVLIIFIMIFMFFFTILAAFFRFMSKEVASLEVKYE